ncbi:hypothetical protein N1851_013018 [Merluccius polli]|uniref:Uncharacterized protein n=1 Tax=Merluccius polli TaxID=89951 RepID=A0AA47P1Z4_MERPO|nr:hypothetical protein N1851_013018 [Merluccius polli]
MADIAPVRLLLILNEDNIVRMELRNGIPNSLEKLIEEYKDTDFGDVFVNLTSTNVIKDLTVIKVVQLDHDTTIIVLYPVDPTMSSSPSQWPKLFPNPPFSYDTECQLQRGNAEYTRSQSRLTLCSKTLSDILERLAEKVYTYKAYPTDADFSDVADALTRMHPCLREHGCKLWMKAMDGNKGSR